MESIIVELKNVIGASSKNKTPNDEGGIINSVRMGTPQWRCRWRFEGLRWFQMVKRDEDKMHRGIGASRS